MSHLFASPDEPHAKPNSPHTVNAYEEATAIAVPEGATSAAALPQPTRWSWGSTRRMRFMAPSLSLRRDLSITSFPWPLVATRAQEGRARDLSPEWRP